MDNDTARRLVADRPWHHDFEIVPGVRTNGTYDPSSLWNDLQLPDDLSGLAVADVGASNGYFSFEARSRGAKVVAFDFRHKDNSGFGLAQSINGMTDIEHHQVNVLQLSPDRYGRFDIVLALGLVYHVADPYRALANCAGLCSGQLFVESYCIDNAVPERVREEPIMRFISDPHRFPAQAHVNNDRSNFWGFTSACLERILEDVGFVVRRTQLREDRVVLACDRENIAASELRLPIAYGCLDAIEVGQDIESPDAWKIF